jgi:hypothetical protein
MFSSALEARLVGRIMFLATHKRNWRLALFFLLLAALPVRAQHTSTRFELGAEYSLIEQTQADHTAITYSGFGGRFDWNLSRRLAPSTAHPSSSSKAAKRLKPCSAFAPK